MSRARAVAAFACGLVFAVGLGVSGMTQPSKVVGFLDLFGAWDASLALVMAGAVGLNFVLFRLILSRPRPLLDAGFNLPSAARVDGRLLAGAVLFGVGWGLAGYCPGPAIVSLATGSRGALTFGAAMLAGMGAFAALTSATQRAR